MRKKLIISTAFLSLIMISSCGSKEVSPITKGIQKLRDGVTLKGNYTQTRQFYTDDTFTQTTVIEGEDLENNSIVEFKFSKDAFARKIETQVGEEYAPYIEQAFFKDENGYAYTEYLSHENTVERNYYGMSEGNLKSFSALGFSNPFEEVYEHDLTLEGDVYHFNLSKASNIFYTLLNSFATGIVNVPKTCTVTLNENSEIAQISYEPITRYVIDMNAQGTENVFYTIEQKLELFVTSSGKGFIEHIEPVTTTEDLTELKTSLDTFSSENITVLYEVKDTSNPESIITKNYNHYYDGENVYIKQYQDGNYGSKDEIDAKRDYLLTLNPNLDTYEARGYDEKTKKWIPSNKTQFGKLNQDRYTYNELTLKLQNIAPELFHFDNNSASYVCDNQAAKYIASKALQPYANELKINELNNATKVSIEIGNGNLVSKVKVDYEYVNFLAPTLVNKGTVSIRFTNSDDTKIPYKALDNLGGNN